jgi:hypothetical protein
LATVKRQSIGNFDVTKLPKDLLISDSGGFVYINPATFPGAFAQDVNSTETDVMAIVQKPLNQAILAEKSGPPAWKQLPTWYQISESDHMIPPDAERMFAKHEIAQLILNAAKGSSGSR